MPTPQLYPRYDAVGPTAGANVNSPGFVSAYTPSAAPAPASAPGPGQVGGPPDPEHAAIAASLNGGAAYDPTKFSTSSSDLNSLTAQYYGNLNTDLPNEDTIRNGIRDNMKAAEDAINQKYNQIFAQDETAALNASGSTRAINARSGNMGSSIGAGNIAGTEANNNKIRAADEAAKATELAGLTVKIDQMTKDEYAAKKAEALGNQKAYIDYLSKSQADSKASIAKLASSGVSIDQIPADQYQKLLKSSGLDDFTFKQLYNESMKPDAKTDYKYEVKGGKIVAYGIDPATGKLVTQSTDLPAGVGNDGEYDHVFGDNGELLLIPKSFDSSKPISDQIIHSGNFAKPKTGTDGTVAQKTTEAVSKLGTYLTSKAGTDKYVDPEDYKTARNAWVSDGFSAADFDTKFSNFINPSRSPDYGVKYKEKPASAFDAWLASQVQASQ